MSNEISALEGEEKLLADFDEALKAEVTARHSYFQLKYFVIGKEPTNQARLWKCLGELKTRREALASIDFEIEECEDQLELLDLDIREQPTPVRDNEIKRVAIIRRQLARKKAAATGHLDGLREKKKYLLQEAQFFYESFKNLEKLEPLKPFDDLEAQKQYWGEKLSQKINLKMLLQNPLDMELIETVIALPDDIPVKTQMIGKLNAIQNQLLQLKEEYRRKLGAS